MPHKATLIDFVWKCLRHLRRQLSAIISYCSYNQYFFCASFSATCNTVKKLSQVMLQAFPFILSVSFTRGVPPRSSRF